jgi:hypothetical protein
MKYIRLLAIPLLFSCLSIPVSALHPQYSTGSLGGAAGKGGSTNAVTVSFLTNGTIQLRLNNQLVSSGIPTLLNASPTFTTGVAISATHGQLTQQYVPWGLVIVYDCVLSGTDLTISAKVQNNGSNVAGPLNLVMPPFMFSGTPSGTMPSWNSSYLVAQGTGMFHPSSFCPLGCVFAGDSNYAVAAWSPSEIARQSLIEASWVSDTYLPNPLPIELHTLETVAPGATGTISIALRVTTDQSPNGIQSGYKLWLPAMSYTPTAAPAVRFQSIGANWVTQNDPYGYDGPWRRLDWPQGVQSYLVTVEPILQAVGGVGVVFWAPGGYQTTTMYPVDYDVNLARIATTWPNLASGFKAAGYRVGIAARLGDALNPDGSVYRANPNSPTDVATMLSRVDYCAGQGIDLWYIDSACNDFASTQMTAIARSHLPASHVFYTEFATDISMSFAGVYCEWDGTQTHWLTELQRSHLMALYPNSSWLCVDETQTLTNAQIVALGFQPFLPD